MLSVTIGVLQSVVGRSGAFGFKGKARDNGPGFLMLTLWLKIVTLVVTVRMKLTIRKGR